MPVFLLLFLAPVYVPLDLLSGWIHAVAGQPADARARGGPGLISGDPTKVLPAFAILFALLAGFALWAIRGLWRAEKLRADSY